MKNHWLLLIIINKMNYINDLKLISKSFKTFYKKKWL